MDKNSYFFDKTALWGHVYRASACLRVTGEDALSFLQGQFTQDLKSATPRSAAYGLWLNQKGKVLADSYVLQEGPECLWVISFWSSALVIRERLEAYVIADDVVIEDLTANWKGVAVGGADAASFLTTNGISVPGERAFHEGNGGLVFRGNRGAGVSFEWLLPVGADVPAGLPELPAEALEQMRVGAGIPRVPQDIGVGDLPNEGGLDEGAISYTKGCYLGQEVMARLKAMGTVRRRLVRVRAGGRMPPAVPCALLQGERRVGELRSVVADGRGGFIGLAMVTKLGLDPIALLAPEPGGDGFIELVDLP